MTPVVRVDEVEVACTEFGGDGVTAEGGPTSKALNQGELPPNVRCLKLCKLPAVVALYINIYCPNVHVNGLRPSTHCDLLVYFAGDDSHITVDAGFHAAGINL